MKGIFLLLLSSCYWAPQSSESTSGGELSCHNGNVPLIECDAEEPSPSNDHWSIVKWFKKSVDYLVGRDHYVCCCPLDRNTGDLVTRDTTSPNDGNNSCRKTAEAGEKACGFVLGSGCFCLKIGKNFFVGMAGVFGGLGYYLFKNAGEALRKCCCSSRSNSIPRRSNSTPRRSDSRPPS